MDSEEEALFVEAKSSLGFCSESCIENFYSSLVEDFERREKKWRLEKNLQGEDILEVVGKPSLMEELLRRPKEIWAHSHVAGSTVYSFIREQEDEHYGHFYLMCLCFVYNYEPSFIISASATRQLECLEQYRWGRRVEDLTPFVKAAKNFSLSEGEGGDLSSSPSGEEDSIEIDEQVMMELENKKSQYLATLIERHRESDIPIESFNLYGTYFEDTMLGADEIYRSQDEQEDTIFTYIKAHEREGVSFYYFIICVQIQGQLGQQEEKEGRDTLFPILSFPSVDGQIYRFYQRGELISGNLRS